MFHTPAEIVITFAVELFTIVMILPSVAVGIHAWAADDYPQ